MEAGESANVAMQASGPDTKLLVAGVIEVSFKSPVKVCVEGATVQAPHWKLGDRVNDGPWSKRPAAYLVDGASGATKDVEVKVKIKKAQNVSGNAKLVGELSGLRITGDCPLSEGEHVVQAKIEKLPAALGWIMGDVNWSLEGGSLTSSLPLNGTRAEISFLFAKPETYFQNQKGVWAEVLRFLFGRAGMRGQRTPAEALARIARYCHMGHKLKYENVGGSAYYAYGGTGGPFLLGEYLDRASEEANCYDQAGAVQVFAGAVGIKTIWVFLQPFGFINTTFLLGYGPCNNPFFGGNGTPQIVDVNHPWRTSFWNHAYVQYSGKILDACAGPHTGGEDMAEYLTASIDRKTKLYAQEKYQPDSQPPRLYVGVTAVS